MDTLSTTDDFLASDEQIIRVGKLWILQSSVLKAQRASMAKCYTALSKFSKEKGSTTEKENTFFPLSHPWK